FNNNAIRKIDLGSSMVSNYAGTGTAGNQDGPGATATATTPWRVGNDGHSLFFSQGKTSSTLRRIDLATGIVSTFVGAANKAGVQTGPLPAAMNAPGGMAATPSGDLVLTDFNEAAVLMIASP